MKFFDKVKESVKKFSQSSAEAAREGVEKLSEKATEYSKLSKIKMEIKSSEHKLDEVFKELGESFYTLYTEKKLQSAADDLKTYTEKINVLEQTLEKQNDELQTIYKEYASHSIDKEKIKILKK